MIKRSEFEELKRRVAWLEKVNLALNKYINRIIKR
jgi:hypothetical protein